MDKQYLNYLKKAFNAAAGYKDVGVNYIEFEQYLRQMRDLGSEYLKILEEFGLDPLDDEITEINKGILDSIAYKNTNFSIVTPFSRNMEKNSNNKIYRFKFISKMGVPRFKTSNGSTYSSDDYFSHTFITQNPYDYSMIEGFSDLSHRGEYNTIFGMYGFTSDKDFNDKTRMLENVRNSMDNYYEERLTDGDKYFYIVRTGVKTKVKSR